MKGKFPTIVMAVMALVLALSLVAVVEPANNEAEAGDLTWSTMTGPSIAVGVYPMMDINDLALSPNYATDMTMYASVLDSMRFLAGGWVGFQGVVKSNMAGIFFSACTEPQNPVGVPPVGPLMIAVAPDNVNYVVVSDGATVWASADGGGTWAVYGTAAAMAAAAAAPVIQDIAVGPSLAGTHPIAVGIDDTAAAAVDANGVYLWGWGSPPSLSWSAQALAEDVWAVAFSPKYASDYTVVAVGSPAAATNVHLGNGTVAVAPPGNWDAAGGYAGWPQALYAQVSTGAHIALPSDFNGLLGGMQVAFAGTAGAALPANNDVWRVRNVGALNLLSGVTGVASLDIVGTIGGSAALMVGDTAASATLPYANLAFTNDPWSAAPWWSGSNKAPTGLGGMAMVALSPDYLTSGVAFCGTGAGGFLVTDESALSKTSDSSLTWNQISLIDTDVNFATADLAPSPNYATDSTLFIATARRVGGVLGTGWDSLWVSVMGGTLWERIDVMMTARDTAIVRVSPNYGTDTTVYWAETGAAGNRIRVSTDGGGFFLTKTVGWAGVAGIADMVVEDSTTLYLASAATVGKSSDSASSWPVMASTFAPMLRMIQDTGTGDLLLSGGGIIYVCPDTTTMTMNLVGQITGEGAGTIQWLAFDPNYATNKRAYAAGGGATGMIWRFDNVGGLGADQSQISLMPTPAIGLEMGDDGILYCADTVAGNGVWRSINPDATPVTLGTVPEWLAMVQGFASLPAAPAITGMWMAQGSSTVLWIRDTVNDPMVGVFMDRILVYTDTLPMTPSLTSPADGATDAGIQVAAPMGAVMYYITLEWSAVSGAYGYGLQLDDASDFANPIINIGIQTVGWGITEALSFWTAVPINQPATSYTTPAGSGSCLVPGACATALLAPNTKYYWRLRVDNTALGTGACVGKWSAARSFTTGPGVGPIVPTITLLSPEAGATNVAVRTCFSWSAITGVTSYGFTLWDEDGAVVADETVSGLSYCLTEDLDDDTSYRWEVCATDPVTGEEVCGAAAFSTGEEAVTPIWVWIVIAIGAVVAIAVIVLIVRTRRPV